MQLIIDDTNYGKCTTYHQNRALNAWIFEMSNSIVISIPFNTIKSFSSSGTLEITTH